MSQPVTPRLDPSAGWLRQQAEAIWTRRDVRERDAQLQVVRRFYASNRLDPQHQAQAASLLATTTNLEAGARAALSPQRAAEFGAVAAIVNQDANARLALRLLLVEGRLTGAGRAADGRDLLGSLAALAYAPLALGIDRRAVIGSVLQEIALPQSINQEERNTCSVATLEIFTALTRPAEYVRIVAGLASPVGAVTLASGTPVRRVYGTEGPDGTSRTISARLWNAALMQLGFGQRSYDNSVSAGGLTYEEVAKVETAITGQTVRAYWKGRPTDFAAAIAAISASANAGVPVPIGCLFDTGGHEVLVTRVDGDIVYVENPHGTEDTMSLATLRRVLDSATISAY